ncbi:unnamed protein product [Owenia fusiformis]|uniref:VWFA domain-containing protein n=1 Tax=Owenia fusiformis TaxID=6347 RepID=A0A8S4N2A4_OWEFU|nr:unnamed protein product [Owenia fusiformis]
MFISSAISCVSVVYFFSSFVTAGRPSIDCNFEDSGTRVSDREDSCIYYYCTSRRLWELRTCAFGASVPKFYRKYYSHKRTKLNLCRNAFSTECYQTVLERKKGEPTPPKPTPRSTTPTTPRPCLKEGQGRCPGGGKCCGDLQCDNKGICRPLEDFVCPVLGEGCLGNHVTNQECCKRDPIDTNIILNLKCGPGKTCCVTEGGECEENSDCCEDQNDVVCKIDENNPEEPKTCSRVEECASLKEKCGPSSAKQLDCCNDVTQLQCSREATCCAERGVMCSGSDDCCRGLECTAKTCQPPTRIECPSPIDIVFAVDTSCSVADIDKDHLRTFMTEVTRAFNIDDNLQDGVLVGALTFNQGYQHTAYLADGKDDGKLLNMIENMNLTEVGCKTNTFTALDVMKNIYFTQDHGERPAAKNWAIVMTDGKTVPPGKQAKTFKNADALRAMGTEVLTIGLPQSDGSIVGEDEWLGIAGGIKENVFTPDFSKLRETLVSIGGRLCGEQNVYVNT